MNHDIIDFVYWIRGHEHAQLAELSIASIRKVYSMPRFVIYTDDPDHTPLIPDTERCVLPAGEPPMVANISAQLLHLVTAPYGRRVLFLDTDTLVRKPFPFDAAHDLFVTWRDHEKVKEGQKVVGVAAAMPYNYGVLGAVATAHTIEAFQWMKARALRMAPQYQMWYANQYALHDLVGVAPKEGEASVRVPIRWVPGVPATMLAVKQLPCEVWNYSPETEAEDVSGKGILHMKGGRKHLMAAYAKEAA